jgi:hypothetical protein
LVENKKVEIPLDYCFWLFDNFDELVEEFNVYGRFLTVQEYAKQKAEEDVF